VDNEAAGFWVLPRGGCRYNTVNWIRQGKEENTQEGGARSRKVRYKRNLLGNIGINDRTCEKFELPGHTMFPCIAMYPESLNIAIKILFSIIKGENNVFIAKIKPCTQSLDSHPVLPDNVRCRDILDCEMEGVSPVTNSFDVSIGYSSLEEIAIIMESG